MLLVTSEMLGLFLKILSDDYRYSRHNREDFQQEIQMQLSQKPKCFSGIFFAFLRISEMSDSDRGG